VTIRRETAMPASDRLSAFISAGAWGAIVGGAALVISFLLEWLVVPYERLGVAAADLTASYLVASSLRLLSTVLFLCAARPLQPAVDRRRHLGSMGFHCGILRYSFARRECLG